MLSYQGFKKWLKTHTQLKDNSVSNYVNAIGTISNQLKNYGLPEKNLYISSDVKFIERVLNNKVFQDKDARGNRMYSIALKHFKRYVEYDNHKNFKAELFRDEVEYEKNIIDNIAKESNISENFIDKAFEKPTYKIVSNHKLWNRNSKFASDSVAKANYLCEFDNSHRDFISKYTQKNYVEAHHLIPMKYQEEFEYSLDVHANIVSLCMVCHKKLHYGLFDGMKEILDKLFEDRKDRLIKSNIIIDLDDLYKYYK